MDIEEPMNLPLSLLRRVAFALAVVSSFAFQQSATAAPKPTTVEPAVQQQRLQKLLNDLHEKNGFPGMTAAVVLPDGKVITAATGYADVESKTPMKADDRMLAGSIGKTFFDAIFMRLAAEGKLDLNQKI